MLQLPWPLIRTTARATGTLWRERQSPLTTSLPGAFHDVAPLPDILPFFGHFSNRLLVFPGNIP